MPEILVNVTGCSLCRLKTKLSVLIVTGLVCGLEWGGVLVMYVGFFVLWLMKTPCCLVWAACAACALYLLPAFPGFYPSSAYLIFYAGCPSITVVVATSLIEHVIRPGMGHAQVIYNPNLPCWYLKKCFCHAGLTLHPESWVGDHTWPLQQVDACKVILYRMPED